MSLTIAHIVYCMTSVEQPRVSVGGGGAGA